MPRGSLFCSHTLTLRAVLRFGRPRLRGLSKPKSNQANCGARSIAAWPIDAWRPTPFHDNGEVDYEGMERVLDCMVDQKVQGICILANYSEQFLLSDEEREKLTKLCMKRIDGRVKSIVLFKVF